MDHRLRMSEDDHCDDCSGCCCCCCCSYDSSSQNHCHLCNLCEHDPAFEDAAASFLSLSFVDSGGSQHIHALEQTLELIDSILKPNYCEHMMPVTGPLAPTSDAAESECEVTSSERRPKSFLHDEMNEFNQIFSELVSTPQRKFPCRDPRLFANSILRPTAAASSLLSVTNSNAESRCIASGLLRTESAPCGFNASNAAVSGDRVVRTDEQSSLPRRNNSISTNPILLHGSHSLDGDPNVGVLLCIDDDDDAGADDVDRTAEPVNETTEARTDSQTQQRTDSNADTTVESLASLGDEGLTASAGSDNHQCVGCKREKNKTYELMNEEDADSGYQTGDSSVPAMVSAAKKLEGVASLSREDLLRRIERFNLNKLGFTMAVRSDSTVYDGNIRVHMNLYRPIKMNLSSRPSSIYDILIRTDALLPEQEPSIATFRLPSNTFKAIHITSETTTNLVIKTLLNKFNITDHPKRFALYERILPSEDAKKVLELEPPQLGNTLSFVRRLADDDRPLELCLCWADRGLELLERCQFVLQENDPGEIMWEDFSIPELSNFLQILANEEKSYAEQIRTKYRLLRRETDRRLQSLEKQNTS